MRRLRFLATFPMIAIGLIMALSFTTIPILATNGVTVTVNTPVEVTSGDTITMYLDITEVTDLAEATVTVMYDPTVLDLVGCSDGQIGQEVMSTICTDNPGEIIANITSTNWTDCTSGTSGDGYLMDLEFDVIGEPCQSTCIDIEGQLSNSCGDPINVVWVDGWICVVNPREVDTYDSTGKDTSRFLPGEDIYIMGSGFATNTDYDIWVVPYEECTWVDEDDILNTLGGPGQVTTITTGGSGEILLTNIGQVPFGDPNIVNYTYWEIVVDNGDGIFNGYDDGLDACCCGERGFNIYPELPTSILFGIGLVGLAGVSGFIVRRRKQSAHKVDQII